MAYEPAPSVTCTEPAVPWKEVTFGFWPEMVMTKSLAWRVPPLSLMTLTETLTRALPPTPVPEAVTVQVRTSPAEMKPEQLLEYEIELPERVAATEYEPATSVTTRVSGAKLEL